ncbi:L,D-transpeptidase family protein [Tessaracoccus oleiagri]|uniref:Peptidoglycan-binding (PGRP) domain of peptidoglycan hydrolases-containing protein n=1 Tax=Tessaracoccus oleiagri TaxID=686624 RepID=A0A1G9LRK0_9ACTN|nr:peptidoglycan-binding protein [Tessaracoccus oleiagri]SDL64407.1 Peptidoglycan-binding (PGRP) domain of peptidoglycan hydrolases-containing protein [Tessaracoccus oleiagri]
MRVRNALTSIVVALFVGIGASGCATQPVTTPRAPVAPPVSQPADPVPTDTAAPEPAPAAPSPTVDPTPTTPAPTTPADPTPTPSAPESPTPEPTPRALFERGDEGDDIRAIQHRLLQLQWFEGPVTGTFGPATQASVEGFQAKRGLPVTGAIDAVTLERLEAMTETPTHDEMYNVLKPGPTILGPGAKGDAVKDLQARLRQIGWYAGKVDGIFGDQTKSGISGFQEKRGFPVTGAVDQRTLDKVHEMTRKPTSDELNNIFPSAKPSSLRLDERCTTGRAICISKKERKLAWVVDGDVKMIVDVRFGSEMTPTREGTFSVQWKSRDHVSSLYDTPMPYALFFSGGQAVHYSADFAARGYNGASHGCVNVRDKAAVASLFDLAKVGDKVIVYSD